MAYESFLGNALLSESGGRGGATVLYFIFLITGTFSYIIREIILLYYDLISDFIHVLPIVL